MARNEIQRVDKAGIRVLTEGFLSGIPQHVHLSNHPGYSLKRPQDFFREYGDYTLRLLKIVKQGYSNAKYEIPPLNTSKALWNCNPYVIGDNFTKETLESLIDKAVSHLQELFLPKAKNLSMTRNQAAAIKTYLDVHDGDAEGNLIRYVNGDQDVHWICDRHAFQLVSLGSVDILKAFVLGHGGRIDIQQATLSIELGSAVEADQFRTSLTNTSFTFDISIKLSWKATRSYIKDLCQDIATTKTVVLAIDGVTLDIRPQDHVQYATNLCADIVRNTKLRLITLLNYPRPQAQLICARRCLVQSMSPLRDSVHSWVELKADLQEFDYLSDMQEVPDINIAVAEWLQIVSLRHGLSNVTMMTADYGNRAAVFDLKKGGFVEAYSLDKACPKIVLSCGSLQTLTVDINNLEFDHEFFHAVQESTSLLELNICFHGRKILYDAEQIVKMWRRAASQCHLTLIDRLEGNQSRIVAQLATRESDNHYSAGGALKGDCVVDSMIIEFLQWDCDQVNFQLSDYSASLIDTATQQHPSILSSLTLDISHISRVGLTSLQNILRRSSLEYLSIVCTPFDPILSDSIAEVLDSVQWFTVKSLVLSGENIDGWLQLWSHAAAYQLLFLAIQGAGPNLQELSHSSVLFVHHLIATGMLLELHHQNIELQEKNDWALIEEIGSVATED
ncbi:hypothetical protein BG000_010535 [Podila horticola]|nr:hypothetical protein BG000_010535 [Podila horticola]